MGPHYSRRCRQTVRTTAALVASIAQVAAALGTPQATVICFTICRMLVHYREHTRPSIQHKALGPDLLSRMAGVGLYIEAIKE